ncbi:hypothetical protein PTKIN_Ptkin08bG0020100 [Pterospermum kingtungense]
MNMTSRFLPSAEAPSSLLVVDRPYATETEAQKVGPKAAAPTNMKTFQIYRWIPDNPTIPQLHDYKFDLIECGPMVLDSLIKIKNEIDPSLTFRRSCHEGICGSCAMNINGCNGLACLTKIESGPSKTIITHLPDMFMIKDLVVDMTNFYNQNKSIEAWLKRKNPPPTVGKEIPQSKKDRAKLDGMYERILCACCSTSCPSYWWNPESYLGPAALLHADREIWTKVLDRFGIKRPIGDWCQELDWMCKMAKGKSVKAAMLRLAWRASIYCIWRERNIWRSYQHCESGV